jgi:hypothetical protein
LCKIIAESQFGDQSIPAHFIKELLIVTLLALNMTQAVRQVSQGSIDVKDDDRFYSHCRSAPNMIGEKNASVKNIPISFSIIQALLFW